MVIPHPRKKELVKNMVIKPLRPEIEGVGGNYDREKDEEEIRQKFIVEK